jgi:hypothetical protein
MAKSKKELPSRAENEEINSRLLDIIGRLKSQQPSLSDLADMLEEEPPFPTYPTLSEIEKQKRRKAAKPISTI